MVFCNLIMYDKKEEIYSCHNPYFNRWFSAITPIKLKMMMMRKVTILILIDGFLQFTENWSPKYDFKRHNPYFNRWFSAIKNNRFWREVKREVTILILIDGFLQWWKVKTDDGEMYLVTILILIDGFLQYRQTLLQVTHVRVTILILIDGFLQYKFMDKSTVNSWCHNPYFNRWFSAIEWALAIVSFWEESQSLF